MPFFTKINNEFGQILVWKLTESWEELSSQIQLFEDESARLSDISSKKRKREFLATRILLEMALGNSHIIQYNRYGKPNLADSKLCISISHSANFACLFISEKKIGIDIEQAERNIDKVANRFLHDKEKNRIGKLSNQQLAKITYWSAKEAVYKCTDQENILFSENIRIRPFQLSDEAIFEANLLKNKSNENFLLKMHLIENNVLVFCVQQ